MAYKNAKNITLSTDKPQTLYRHIRDFLTGTGLYNGTTGVGGWTVLFQYESVPGNVSLNDWCLIKTTGESGTWDFRLYLRNTTLGIIAFGMLGITNTTAATPTYVTALGMTGECLTLPATWTAAYLYADRDFLVVVLRTGTTNVMHRIGIARNLEPAAHQPQALLSATAAGSNIQCSVTNSNHPHWNVGNRIQFFSWEVSGGAGGRVETSQITNNDTTTNIVTMASQAYTYPIGASICTFFPYIADSTVAKSNFTGMQAINMGLEQTTPGTITPGISSPLAVDATHATNLYTGKFHAQTPYLASSGAGGGASLLFPEWFFYTKKRAVEEEVHTDGTSNYRYFSMHSDAAVGVLLKDV